MISQNTNAGTKVWNSALGFGELLGFHDPDFARVKFNDIDNVVIISRKMLTEMVEK